MATKKFSLNRGLMIGIGVLFLVLSLVILGMGFYEAVMGVKKNYHSVTLPGSGQLNLESPGVYAGIYQHQSEEPFPTEFISQLDIRLFSTDDYSEVPVVVNRSGQVYQHLGQTGMLLFNFAIQNPGPYSLSGIYLEADNGPSLPIVIFAQAAQDIKQTLIVALLFFVLFLVLGIVILVQFGRGPKTDSPPLPSAPEKIKKK